VREADHRGVQGVDRGHVDHAAAVALLDHPPRDGLREQEDAGEVDGEYPLEQRGGHVEERRLRIDAGVVDEDVDAPIALDGAGDDALDRVRVADVGGHGEGADGPLSAQRVGERLGGVGLQVGDDHVRPGFVQPVDDGRADAGGTAGDDRGLAGEVDERAQRDDLGSDGAGHLTTVTLRGARPTTGVSTRSRA
jgi:hypothetical protein